MLGILRFCVRIYQVTFSPLLQWLSGPGAGCRFHPSCSEYFLQAIESHGAGHGTWLGLKRIARCHPWGGQGDDPVPGRIHPAGVMARPECE
ncbi:MAG TPA: membrane protein insertion efficiency factor YidD [Chthoniobacterales bacterium]